MSVSGFPWSGLSLIDREEDLSGKVEMPACPSPITKGLM